MLSFAFKGGTCIFSAKSLQTPSSRSHRLCAHGLHKPDWARSRPSLQFSRANSSIENPPGGSCLSIKDVQDTLSAERRGTGAAPSARSGARGCRGQGRSRSNFAVHLSCGREAVTGAGCHAVAQQHSLHSTAPWYLARKLPRSEVVDPLPGMPGQPYSPFQATSPV